MTSKQTWLTIVLGLALVGVSFSQPGFAQSADEFKALRSEIQGLRETQNLRNDVQAVKDSQAAMQRDLQEIKNLLQQPARQAPAAAGAPAQPQNIVITTDGNAYKGNKDAKFALVEFTDYQCPFCSRHVKDTFPEIDKDYIKTGKIKYIVREMPLESIHPLAFKAAEAAQCAGEQGKYWELHDRFFADQKTLGANDMPKHAEALGLDAAKFQACISSGKFATLVRRDMADAQKAGITGTPSFFLGVTQPDGSVKVVNTLKGAQPIAAFRSAIDGMLAAQP